MQYSAFVDNYLFVRWGRNWERKFCRL